MLIGNLLLFYFKHQGCILNSKLFLKLFDEVKNIPFLRLYNVLLFRTVLSLFLKTDDVLYYKSNEERSDAFEECGWSCLLFSLNEDKNLFVLLVNIVGTTVALPNFLVGKFLLVDGYHEFLAICLRIYKNNQFVKPFFIVKLCKNPSFFIEGTLLYCVFVSISK